MALKPDFRIVLPTGGVGAAGTKVYVRGVELAGVLRAEASTICEGEDGVRTRIMIELLGHRALVEVPDEPQESSKGTIEPDRGFFWPFGPFGPLGWNRSR
jgi:hypothetical protein